MFVMLFRWLLALGAFGLATAAQAGCTTSAKSLVFAPSSSYDVASRSVAQVSGSAGLSCSGSLLSLLGGSYARATITSANGFKLSTGGTDAIPYQLSADPGGTVVFAQGGTVDYMSAELLSLLGILSVNSFTPPLYAKLTAGPNIAAGTYTDVLTVNWDYSVCNGVQVGALCVLYETGRPTTTVTVTVVVSADCRISAPNISFGTAALISQFSAVSQAVLVDCTKGSLYKVAFSGGQAGSARPWRAMKSSAGDSLQYNIYKPDGTTVWDESNPTTAAAPGTGATTPSQLQSYVAKVNPGQATPPAGTYTDTVSVVISF